MKISLFILIAGLAAPVMLFAAEPSNGSNTHEPTKSAPVFDAAGKRIVLGSKVLQIFPSGYLSFLYSGREISKIFFYGSTPYSSWMTNQKKDISVPCKYGRRLGVDSFETDEEGKSFTVKGKIPYHKKSDNELLGDYRFAVKLLESGKVSIRLEMTRPAGRSKEGGMNIMWVTPGAVKYLVNGKENVFPTDKRKQNQHWRPKTVQVVMGKASDAFSLSPKSAMTFFARQGNLLALTPLPDKKNPDRCMIEVELDAGK